MKKTLWPVILSAAKDLARACGSRVKARDPSLRSG